MSGKLPELERDLARLLESEKPIDPIAPAAKARALAAVLARVAPSGSGGGDDPPPANVPPTAGPAASLAKLLGAHPAATALTTFALGAATGVGWHASPD